MAQFLRPDSNITKTSFTLGFAVINESTANDSNYAFSDNGAAGVLEVGLSDPASTPDPAGTSTVRFRIAKVDNGNLIGTGNSVTITSEVYQGTTLIQADSARTATGSWVGYSFTFTHGSITDWTDVRLRFSITTNSGGSPSNRRGGAISWAEVEAPDAAAQALVLTADAGSFTVTGVDAGVTVGRRLTAGTGSISLAGNDAGLAFVSTVTADTGKFFLPERNLTKYSEELDNAVWGKVQVGALPIAPVVTPNQDVAPDGTLTADRVVFDLNGSVTPNDRSYLNQPITTTVGQDYTFSVWMRSADGISRSVRLSLEGLGAQNVTVTSSWQRFSVTATAFDTLRHPRISLRVGSGSSDYADLYIWGAQFEEGSLSDYDPTGPNAAVITRVRHTARLLADVRAYTLTGIAADLRETARLVADVRALTLTGVSAFPRPGRHLTAQTGALTLTGVSASPQAGRLLTAQAGELSLTGVSADLIEAATTANTLVADVGAFMFEGSQAGLYRDYQLVTAVRAFSLTGNQATLRRSWLLLGSTGTYQTTGADAELTYSQPPTPGSRFTYQTVVLDPLQVCVNPDFLGDQLNLYVKGFYRII